MSLATIFSFYSRNLPMPDPDPTPPLRQWIHGLLCCTALIIPLWPEYIALKINTLPAISPERIVLALLIPACLIDLIHGQHSTRMSRPCLLAMLAFWSWTALSVNSTGSLKAFSHDLLSYLPAFWLAWRYADHQLYRKLLLALATATLLVSLLSILEAWLSAPLLADYAPPDLASSLYRSRDGIHRVSATFANPLGLAMFLCMTLPLMAYAWQHSHNRSSLLFASAGISGCYALWHTHSRAGLLILLLMAGWGFWQAWRPVSAFRRRIVYLLLVLATTAALTGIIQHETAAEHKSSMVRWQQLQKGLPLIMAHPWRGYGPGQAITTLNMEKPSVDNYYLTLTLESGLPTALIYISMLLYILYRLHTKILPASDSPLPTAHMLAMVIGGQLIFLSVVSIEQLQPLLWMMLGLAIRLTEQQGTTST